MSLYETKLKSKFWTSQPETSIESESKCGSDELAKESKEIDEIRFDEKILEQHIRAISKEFSMEDIVTNYGKKRIKKMMKYASFDRMWPIELVNVEEFGINMNLGTISFIHKDPVIVSLYFNYFQSIQKLYSNLRDNKIGSMPLRRIVKGYLAVVDLKDEGFVRAQIDSSYNAKHLNVIVRLLDYNSYRLVDSKDVMYPTTLSTKFACQANDLFLDGLTSYYSLIEFHSATLNLVKEHGTCFTAKVTNLNNDGVAFVELFHPSHEISFNEIVKISTIKLMREEKLPAVGEFRSWANIVHIDDNADVFFQFPSTMFEVYREEINSISTTDFISAQQNGPFKLSKDKIYLATYRDGYFYRAKLLNLPGNKDDKVDIIYIDFGNKETVSHKDLVPADVINPYLPHFPPQAIKGHLINVAKIDVQFIRKILNADKTVGVETVKEATGEMCGCVEILIFKFKFKKRHHQPKMLYLTEELRKNHLSATKDWDEPLLKGRITDSVTFSSLEIIDMECSSIWCNSDGIPVDLKPGVILDVFIAQTNTPADFSIQPYGLQESLRNVESELTTYNNMFEKLYNLWTEEVLLDTLYCSMYLMDLQSYVRVRLAEYPYGKSIGMRVLLLDYGRYVDVLKKKLCKISIEACKLPCIGAQGCLTMDKKKKMEEWSDEHILAFRDNVCHKRFLFKLSCAYYDENKCLKLTGDLYDNHLTSVNTDTTGELIEDSKKALKELIIPPP